MRGLLFLEVRVAADKPTFRFHPGAYERSSLVKSDESCDACGEPSGWLYASIVYVEEDEPQLCARCIAGGKLTDHFDGDYSLHDADFDDEVDDDMAEEVMQRTPGFATYNAFEWPVMDGKPMVYVGHGDEGATWANAAAADAIRKVWADRGQPLKSGEKTPYGLVFKELDGDRHVAIIDLD